MAGAIAVIAVPGIAAAHVTLNPTTAAPGGYGAFDVRVPNEEATASTTRIQLFLPTDHPIASVSVQPVPGWTVATKQGKLDKPITTDDGTVSEAITEIDWTGGAIKPGEFQQFPVSLGPLPDNVKTLYFKALQTYSDGTVVRWIDLPQGSAEPDHPAPSITLAAATAASAAAPVGTTQAGDSTRAAASDHDGTAIGLAIGALAVAVLGLVAGGYGLVTARRAGKGGPA